MRHLDGRVDRLECRVGPGEAMYLVHRIPSPGTAAEEGPVYVLCIRGSVRARRRATLGALQELRQALAEPGERQKVSEEIDAWLVELGRITGGEEGTGDDVGVASF